MPARSSLLALLALGGCDVVFGLEGQPDPCPLASFAGASPVSITEADVFTIDWDQTLALIEQGGLMYELSLRDQTRTPIDVSIYNHVALGLAPDGASLFYTAATEPYELQGALRADSSWHLGAAVPRGTFAGTPSADAFGPRRVLVGLRQTTHEVQEFIDEDGVWQPIGESFEVPADLTINLTPDGLTMVYSGSDSAGVHGIYAASRESVEEPFGPPIALLVGDYRGAQLCGKCKQLYTITGSTLVRFE